MIQTFDAICKACRFGNRIARRSNSSCERPFGRSKTLFVLPTGSYAVSLGHSNMFKNLLRCALPQIVTFSSSRLRKDNLQEPVWRHFLQWYQRLPVGDNVSSCKVWRKKMRRKRAIDNRTHEYQILVSVSTGENYRCLITGSKLVINELCVFVCRAHFSAYQTCRQTCSYVSQLSFIQSKPELSSIQEDATRWDQPSTKPQNFTLLYARCH